MEQKKYILQNSTQIKATLPESPIIRNDKKSYFTFSPFQDTESYFLEQKEGNHLKFQLCIRYLNKLSLRNPMNINMQETFTIQNYVHKNQVENITNIIKLVLDTYNLCSSKVIIFAHEKFNDDFISLEQYFQVIYGQNDFTNSAYTSSAFVANIPVLKGKHFYVKVGYRLNGGCIIIGNFVLINYSNNNGFSQLDSIFYPERIGTCVEDCKYIYNQDKYRYLIEPLYSLGINCSSSIHRICNDILVINKLSELGIKIENKGIGNELKRKVKKFSEYFFFYINDVSSEKFYEEIIEKLIFDEEVVEYFKKCLIKMEQWDRNDLSNIDQTYAKNTFGIPKEFWGVKEPLDFNIYNFDR